MAKRIEDYIAKLPADQQAEVERRADLLVREEMSLRELRRALKLSQEELAQVLNVGQSSVAKMERRTDAFISTVRRFVEAMGGQLDIVARFPDSEPVSISNFGELDDGNDGTDGRATA